MNNFEQRGRNFVCRLTDSRMGGEVLLPWRLQQTGLNLSLFSRVGKKLELKGTLLWVIWDVFRISLGLLQGVFLRGILGPQQN